MTIVVQDDVSLSLVGVEPDQLAKWLESLGCTTAVARPAHVSGKNNLSLREQEIVGLIGDGLSNVEIASRLYLSVNSIKSYIRSAYRKMGVTSRSGAVRWAISHELTRI